MDDADLEIGEEREVAPGVVVQRRSFFKLLAAAFAVLPAHRLLAEEVASSTLTFAGFLAVAVPVAKELVSDTSLAGQDRYLLTLASAAVRLSDVPAPEMRDSGQGETAGTFIGFNPGGEPFTVLHWKMNPRTAIRLHAHTYGNVVTLGLEGDAVVENYEVAGEKQFASETAFDVRRTRRQWLSRGGVNLVSLERDYIHGIRAGSNGARGLDITTRIRSKEPTPYLVFRDKADASREIRRAHWSFDAPKK